MRLRGRPSREQQRASDEFSRQLLREYMSSRVTYEELAEKYELSTFAIFRRLQRARDMLDDELRGAA